MNSPLPKAILLDLDDTILNDTGSVKACWESACNDCATESGVGKEALLAAITRASEWFWSDPERHRIGRLNLRVARVEVVRLAMAELGVENVALGQRIGGIYDNLRNEAIDIFPDAVDTIRWFEEWGCRLALLTNGDALPQRNKIRRFNLESHFAAIFIEGEVGFGKPDERVYKLALDALGVNANEAWMVGDNLEWDVAQPQRLGIFGIWIDRQGKGHPKLESTRPGRIIRTLSDLRIPASSCG